MLFHHDPMHSDERLDQLGEEARERWAAMGGREGAIELAVERRRVRAAGAGGQRRFAS